MKLTQAKEIAQEIYDGKISVDEFKEGTTDECHYRVISNFFIGMVERDASWDKYKDTGLEVFGRDPINTKPKFIRTWGTKKLDEEVTPIEDSSYVLIAGGENSGKTSYMLDFAKKNAQEGGKVLFYSLEMTEEQIISRFAMEKAGITKAEYRTREIPENKKKIYHEEYKALSNIDGLWFKGTGDNQQSFDDMLAEIAEINPDLCIIDNLGLINEYGGNEIEQHMKISRKLIGFTNTQKIPIVLIHHLSKKKGKAQGAIRGTQKLMDDPDIVLLAGRKSRESNPNMNEQEASEFWLMVKKDRQFGDTGRKHCIYFDKGTFTDSGQLGF